MPCYSVVEKRFPPPLTYEFVAPVDLWCNFSRIPSDISVELLMSFCVTCCNEKVYHLSGFQCTRKQYVTERKALML
ncbi:hypothetical protein AVEN_217315-1, partial [Araneus ventricosus]